MKLASRRAGRYVPPWQLSGTLARFCLALKQNFNTLRKWQLCQYARKSKKSPAGVQSSWIVHWLVYRWFFVHEEEVAPTERNYEPCMYLEKGQKRCTKDSYVTLWVSLTREKPRNLELKMVSALILNCLTSVDLHWDLSHWKYFCTWWIQKAFQGVYKATI